MLALTLAAALPMTAADAQVSSSSSVEELSSSGRGFLSFLDAETISIINLFTSFLLLGIVWLVLAPILDGTVSIVRNDQRFVAPAEDRLQEILYERWAE